MSLRPRLRFGANGHRARVSRGAVAAPAAAGPAGVLRVRRGVALPQVPARHQRSHDPHRSVQAAREPPPLVRRRNPDQEMRRGASAGVVVEAAAGRPIPVPPDLQAQVLKVLSGE